MGAAAAAPFTTNRHWGERTEGKPRLNTDGTPVLAFNPETGLYDGEPIVDGWRLVFENFGDDALDINTYELAFHGINTAGTGRIQGAVGVDDNIDGVFSDSTGPADNFTRYLEFERTAIHPVTGEEVDFRYVQDGSYQFDRFINPDQESWAAGVIVYVDLDQNGVRDHTDPHYQVGADGNYYFDLPAGFSYDVRIDANSLEAAGLYNQQNVDIVADVLATATIAAAGERVLATPVQGEEGATTIIASYGFNFGMTSSVPEMNILLVPNAIPENVVTIGGTVYADLNENGIQDGDDVGIADAVVFIDINQNGVYSPGVDIIAYTDADGKYQFTDPFTGDELLEVTPGFYTVRVLAGTTGTFSEAVNPSPAVSGFFFAPELVRNDVDFGFTIGEPGTGSPNAPVAISGVVFEDNNESGSRQSFERGLAGNVATVYIDLNGNNQFDPDEPTANLTPNGSFVFNSLPAGTYTVRIDFDDIHYQQTTPRGSLLPDGTRANEDDWEFEVTINPGQAVTGLLFGLKNNATSDWGDLPAHYGATTAAQNGARHIYDGHMFLGSSIDTELDGIPSVNADGDDTTGINDEDGVVFSTLLDTSTTMTITVTASTNGGWLQGWMDWNEDGVFSGASERVFDDVLLAEGENVFVINVPNDVLTNGTVYARFRYGEEGIDSIHGQALKGEVEDYAIPVVSTVIDPGARIIHGPDFNEDGYVDGRDFLAWQRGFGITSGATAAQGDADSDGDVDRHDLAMWREEYGTSPGAVAALKTGGYTIDSPIFAAELARRYERRPLVPLVTPSVTTEDLAAPSYTDAVSSVEASAQASTFGQSDAGRLAFGAGLGLNLRFSETPAAQRMLTSVQDFDSAFDHFDRLRNLASSELDSTDRLTSARHLRSEDERVEEEDAAFALAFADEADWWQL